jgi:hypothetical protein
MALKKYIVYDFVSWMNKRSRDSSASKAMGYRLDGPGLIDGSA